jgi:Tfp pilus assembly protein PilF
MLPGTVLLFALAAAQAPAVPAPGLQEKAAAAEPAPTAPAVSEATDPHIAAGLAAFRKRHFAAARAEFEKAVAADPQSAAANFYLGYVHYKIGEPKRRMNADKEQAKELFAKAFSLDPAFKPAWK